ncbi:50S ribosomal protein L32e [Candidatus Bathyarchaeota archaeon]|nr:50S ribosomal protein L32e [Candidatus Bathyarchaeota archaeon]
MKRPSTSGEKVLKLRARVKKQKPSFVRQESWRHTRLKENWRKPRGLDNKMRRKIKGWPRTVEVGYRGPKVARGLHPSGYEEVLVYNAEQLWELDPKTQAAKIGHTVGKRKRARIIVEAKKRKIIILNFKEPKEVAKEELAEEAEKKEAIEEEKAEEATEEAETEKEKPKPKKKRKRRSKEKQ